MSTSKKSKFFTQLSKFEGSGKFSLQEGRTLSEESDRLERDDLLAISHMTVGRPKAGEEREESEVFSVRLPKSLVQKLRSLAERLNLTRNRLAAIAFQRQVIDPISEDELKILVLKKAMQSYFLKINSNLDEGTTHSTFQSITGIYTPEIGPKLKEIQILAFKVESPQLIRLTDDQRDLQPEIPNSLSSLRLAGACE